jgi:hypothetical protein
MIIIWTVFVIVTSGIRELLPVNRLVGPCGVDAGREGKGEIVTVASGNGEHVYGYPQSGYPHHS